MINLIKTEKYHLLHNWIYWCGMAGIFLLGLFTAETYVEEIMGPEERAARSLIDIFNGMVYDSTFLLILISCILALILGQEFSHRTIHQEVSAGHSRFAVFTGKTMVYLFFFNLMALVYPVGGCIREFFRFGIGDVGILVANFVKVALYSFLLNSIVFMIPILCCFWLRSTYKALSAAAFLTFALSLYLGYGLLFHLPVKFLPLYQIREAVKGASGVLSKSLVMAAVWGVVLMAGAWRVFRKCELK